jgi:hypothetical protein
VNLKVKFPKPTREPSEIDWARLSAFIDGEGSITIDNKMHPSGKRLTYLKLAVYNSDPRLPEWLRERFGGAIYLVDRGGQNWAKSYAWQVSAALAASILTNCLNFFVIKREQAEIGLAHQRLVFRPGIKGHDPKNYEHRLELRDQLSMLKTPTSRRKDLREQPTIQ